MQESISAPQVGGIVRRTRFILAVTLVLEGQGRCCWLCGSARRWGLFRGLWYAVFHAVSSFCNAGFDLMGAAGTPFVPLTGYAGDPLVNFTVMGLIVLGGIGFLTWGRRAGAQVAPAGLLPSEQAGAGGDCGTDPAAGAVLPAL